jgi:hypothetical protein
MIPADKSAPLSLPHQKALQRAFVVLENPRLAARLAEYAGQPVRRVLRMLPEAANAQLNGVVESAILRCLRLAINSIEPAPKRRPEALVPTVLVGLSGGLSGFFGAAALPLELPVTTTIMLRTIAEIARYAGEDLSTLEARLACVEVFALGSGGSDSRLDVGYFASRVLLSKLASDASALLLERGIAGASAPTVNRLVVEIASRFGIVISERVAAGAVPVLGALGGATLNVIFMNHFQRIARGHFTVRRLERQYGVDVVRRCYEGLGPRRLQAER